MSVTITRTDVPEEIDPPDIEYEETDDPDAPYGFEEDGTTPKAPFGYRKDGKVAKKRGRAKGSTGGGGRTKNLSHLKEPLMDRLVEYIGAPIAFVSPIGAMVWEDRAEKTADAILILASRSVRWRKWVERLIAGSATSDLGITIVGVFTGWLVDIERVDPEGAFPRRFKIDMFYHEIYGEFQRGTTNSDNARGLYAEVS